MTPGLSSKRPSALGSTPMWRALTSFREKRETNDDRHSCDSAFPPPPLEPDHPILFYYSVSTRSERSVKIARDSTAKVWAWRAGRDNGDTTSLGWFPPNLNSLNLHNFSQNRRDDWYIFDEIQRREGMTVLNQVGRQLTSARVYL